MAKKPPAGKNTPPSFSDDTIADLIDARDVAGLLAALDAGLSPQWRDEAGRGLNHFAAAWNDEKALRDFTARGVPLHDFDKAGRSPQDMARMMGHDGLAYRIAQEPVPARGAADIGYDSLDAIRQASQESLADIFNLLVLRGDIEQVVALARKDANGFSASDFLGKDAEGDSTILKICQRGELSKVMDVAAWKERPEEFGKLWAHVPQQYAAGHDVDSFLSAAHQARLQNFAMPDFKLGRRPPKGPKP